MTGERDPVSVLAEGLAEVLSEHLRKTVRISGLKRLAGGQSHETWAFDASPGELHLVLRRDFAGGSLLAARGEDEYRLTQRLHELGLPVPEPLLHHADPELLGAPFALMRRVGGEDLRKALSRPRVQVDRRALGLELVGAQAALHAIDPAALDGILAASAEDVALGEVERWATVIDDVEAEPEPLLGAALGWLRDHAPPTAQSRVVHGDFKANNLLFAGGGVVAVLDWEMAHLGDPVEDLAWTMLWDTKYDLVGGLLEAGEYVRAYEQRSGTAVDPDALAFWWLFSLVKLMAIFQTGVRPGADSRPTLAMLGRATPVLETRIADFLGDALQRELV